MGLKRAQGLAMRWGAVPHSHLAALMFEYLCETLQQPYFTDKARGFWKYVFVDG